MDSTHEKAAEPIVNGDLVSQSANPHVAALYHGFTRPCSSTRLTYSGWYLTARHCLTTDSSVWGPLLPLSAFSLVERVDAGLTPPPDAKPAQQIIASPNTDMGLVYVPGFPVEFGGLSSFWFASASSLVSTQLFCFGYGRFDGQNTDVENGTSGAGTLRRGLLTVSSATGSSYDVSVNAFGQILAHGDSGGPCYNWQDFGGGDWARIQTGVHATSNLVSSSTDTVISADLDWIEQNVGWMYIKRATNAFTDPRYLDVQWNNSAAGTIAWTWSGTDTSAQHWRYYSSDKTIRNQNGNCLDVQWNATANGTPVWMWTCNGSTAQQWSFTSDLHIQNVNGKCLDVNQGSTATGVPLQIWDCNTGSAQRWLIGAAP